MAYSQQSFSTNNQLNAAELNQIEVNIRDHVHGKGNIAHRIAASFYSEKTTIVASYNHVIDGFDNYRYNNGFTIDDDRNIFVTNTGWYEVTMKLAISFVFTGTTISLEVWKNSLGSASIATAKQSNGIGELDYYGFGFVYIEPADSVRCRVYCNVLSSTINHSINTTFINMAKV